MNDFDKLLCTGRDIGLLLLALAALIVLIIAVSAAMVAIGGMI